MKPFRSPFRQSRHQGGFSLVEATLSLGLMTFGLFTLTPLLVLGFQANHGARTDRDSAQIAQTLAEEARQGTLAAGTTYFDSQGNDCSQAQAIYTVQATLAPVTGQATLTRLTLLVTPRGAPDHARTYAVVFAPAF